MSNPANNDEESLARLVRKAGDPRVSPDAQYIEKLRAKILERVAAAQTSDDVTVSIPEAEVASPLNLNGSQIMRSFTRIVVAATVLAVMGGLVGWFAIGSTNIAFAEVAKALDNLRTATFDETTEVKNPLNGKTTTFTSKSFFLAPSHQRCEGTMSTEADQDKVHSIMILDMQTMKGLTLLPKQELAVAIDVGQVKKPPEGPSNMFEMVRQLVREGIDAGGAKVESLGKQEIDGRVVVGFRTHSNMIDMTLWADPQTARPVRIEIDSPSYNSQSVMSNFRYDMELAPSLFSLEPPPGYTVKNMEATMPVEDDLVNILRLVAKHNNGVFPPTIGTNKEYMQAIQAASKEETEKFLKTPETKKLLEKLKAQYGQDKDGFMKAWMEATMPLTQKLTQKHIQGVMFYRMLKPENDPHYAGKDVKLGTPDHPILWYRPTGAEKYRVIYADLSVKEVAPEEVKQWEEEKAK